MTNAIIDSEVLQCKCSKCTTTAEYKLIGTVRDFMGKRPIHSISLGLMPSSSRLDDKNVDFELCDLCLYNLVNDLREEVKDEITFDPFAEYANAMKDYVHQTIPMI